MQFDILGPLQVRDAGRPLALGRPKQRAVLAILLLSAGSVVSLDRLVEELWGPQSPPQALASVQAYVSHLRRLLEPQRAPGAPATVVVNQAPGYRIVVDPDDLDAARFEALARTGHDLLQQGEAPRAAETLAEALALWRGPVLADLADAPFVQAERARLDDLRLTALEDRLGADLRLGRHARVVAELERLTGEHPFRERLQGLRMTALYRCGRQAEALQSYQQFRAQLREELGLDPGQALRDLERDVLRQATALDWAGASADRAVAPGPAPSAAPVPPRSPAPPAAVAGSAAPGGLVGRDAHLQVVDRALAGTATGRGRVVLVAGEPGIGKTRLAEEATRRARGSGVTVAWGRSDPDAGAPPFWPWTQVLRALLGDAAGGPPAGGPGVDTAELARILPRPADGEARAAAPVVDPEASRFRLCQAATATLLRLARGRRLLVVLDDLQWADVASLRLLGHLATTLAEAPVVVLVTYRDRTLDGGEPLADTLGELARTAPVDRLELTGLAVADVARVMASHLGTDPDDGLVRLVRDRTGGNPFFVLEVLRLLGSGRPERTAGEAASLVAQEVPAGVRDVLRRRLGRLPDQIRTVLLVAAVVGQQFDLDVVRAVTGLDDDDALAAVELTVSAGLVVEDPATVGRFRFAHALIREAVYGEISRARRARLHARVGQALLDRRGDDADSVLQLAQHWWLAAPVVGAERAVPHVIAAAELSLDTFAHEEAERQLRRSLDLLAAAAPTRDRDASELAGRLRLGRLLVQLHGSGCEHARAHFSRARELADGLGDRPALLAACRSLYEVAFARADHSAAAALAEVMLDIARSDGDPAALVVSHLALGRTLWSQGRLAAARDHLEQGLRVAGPVDGREFLPPRIVLQLQLAAVLTSLDEPDAGIGLLSTAVRDSRGGSPFVQALTLTGAALVSAMRRDPLAARRWATETLELVERWHLPWPAGYAAVVLSWVHAVEDDPAAAIPALREHLARTEAGGTQHLVGWGLGLLAEAHLCAGEPLEGLRLLDDALARVARTGERSYESELHRLRALCLVALTPPRPEEAHAALRRAADVAREQGSALLLRRAAETCRAIDGRHSGSCDHPGAQP
ncbi:Transcriptional regulatory protein, C terminal [Geodermatophilus dictyosporus]|uniref:Transcriptional regulatory protein, C terminal n=1 Tax=Geodermatophilus dictyosporus TaxID=1523247 RepID=A0A1I5K0E2_9ACTN|nr:BTAD domain-containing putative transcriptional regulator [Geodermatophilus dictyosporus]SFO78478.1 Transcriptional regulatory protein, C terminal [Geodermatophilus dictyosporus]